MSGFRKGENVNYNNKKKNKTQLIRRPEVVDFMPCDDSRAQQEEPSPGTTQSMESHGLS